MNTSYSRVTHKNECCVPWNKRKKMFPAQHGLVNVHEAFPFPPFITYFNAIDFAITIFTGAIVGVILQTEEISI